MSEKQASEVQAELQEYLNSKNINNLFLLLVEALLTEKPDNPISFVIEYLQKKYPDLAAEVHVKAMREKEREERKTSSFESKKELDSDDSDTDSDNEEDYEEFERRAKKRTADKRRTGVSAEVSSALPKLRLEDVPHYPKSHEERERIDEILRNSILLSHLDEDTREMVVNAMQCVDIPKGETIITEGEDGDNFYLLDTGSVEVFKAINGENQKVHSYGPGGAFGELAIMYNAPRAATCVSSSPCKLWALERNIFKAIMTQSTTSKRDMYRDFLSKVPILESMTDYEQSTIADVLVEEVVASGEVICRQGEEGETFYIIKEGNITCTQTDANGQEVEMARLTSGDYFGEIALLTSNRRQATVTALSVAKLLTIRRVTFDRVMGPLEDILKRNIDNYQRVTSSQI
jgi:cAMP-dependent protein kinase regulator